MKCRRVITYRLLASMARHPHPPLRASPPRRADAWGGAVTRRGTSAAAPDRPDRLHLALDVGDDGPIAVPLQPLVDERAQHHLEAHRSLQSSDRLAREHARPIQDLLGENEQDPGLVLEHRHLRVRGVRHIFISCYVTYIMIVGRGGGDETTVGSLRGSGRRVMR